MRLETRQAAFAAALLDPEAAVPEGIVGPDGGAAPKRFAVYRNNVTVGLTEALATSFPVVRRIVGEDFFAAMARAFVRAHPPRTPLLMFYGEAFPDFLEGFGPVAHLTYLGEVARLEQLRREAYHAADAEPLAPDFLGQIAPERLGGLRFALHPSVRLLEARHPALSIWEWNRAEGEAERPALPNHGEAILVARPELDVEARRLPAGGYGFVSALAEGAPLQAAAERGMADPGFDLTACIALLLESRIVTGFDLDGASS